MPQLGARIARRTRRVSSVMAIAAVWYCKYTMALPGSLHLATSSQRLAFGGQLRRRGRDQSMTLEVINGPVTQAGLTMSALGQTILKIYSQGYRGSFQGYRGSFQVNATD